MEERKEEEERRVGEETRGREGNMTDERRVAE